MRRLRNLCLLAGFVIALGCLAWVVLAICPAYDGEGFTNLSTSSPLDTDQISGGAACIRQTRAAAVGAMVYEHHLSGEGIRFFGNASQSFCSQFTISVGVQTTNIAPGTEFAFVTTCNNGGGCSLTVNNTNGTAMLTDTGTTSPSILYEGAPLANGMIQSGVVARVIFDGANYQLENPMGSASTVGSGNGVYIGSVETIGSAKQTWTGDVEVGSISLPSNTYSYIQISASVELEANTGANPTFNWVQLEANSNQITQTQLPYAMKLNGPNGLPVTVSTITTGGQTTNTYISVNVESDNNTKNANTTAQLLNLRLFGYR